MQDFVSETFAYQKKNNQNIMKWMTPAFIFLLTFIVRTYNIEKGAFVTWDEAHFGKFSSKYLLRSFYFDVHPPLGKMLTALSGYLSGQPTDFAFDSGSPYPHNFDFVNMRRLHALISSLTPVFGYFILKELKYSWKKRFLLSMVFIFENGFTSIGRLILLDSHLLTGTSAVIYYFIKVFNEQHSNSNLVMLGITLGLVLSIKWIGCFTTLLVGIYIIFVLWRLLNSKKSIVSFLRSFVRFFCFLVLLPVSIYIGLFYFHFWLVNKASPDEGHMSSFFQSNLIGNSHIKNRKYVVYATRITLKNMAPGAGYLHSHDHKYPDSQLNQITSYSHKDNNNNWALQKVSELQQDILYLQHNDKVVLFHMETTKYLTITKKNSYLSKGILVGASSLPLSDNNVFVVEIVKDSHKLEERVKSITTVFRLKHSSTGLYLKSTTKKYPDWGFLQGEIVCSLELDEGSLWTVEENISNKISEEANPRYDEIYKSVFLKNFIEHNILQYKVNKSFVQDENLEPDVIVSKPYEWPILYRGLRMCNWAPTSTKFYMFGNPLLWYTSTLCVLLAPLIYLTKYIQHKRGTKKYKNLQIESLEVFICIGGWALHYLPFFLVDRVLYFHHYYPALFFALLSVAYVLKHVSLFTLQTFIGWVIYSYIIFSPLTYGFIDTDWVQNLKLIPSWDFIE